MVLMSVGAFAGTHFVLVLNPTHSYMATFPDNLLTAWVAGRPALIAEMTKTAQTALLLLGMGTMITHTPYAFPLPKKWVGDYISTPSLPQTHWSKLLIQDYP